MPKPQTESEFEKYSLVQYRLFESDFDRAVKQVEAERGVDTLTSSAKMLEAEKKAALKKKVLACVIARW